MLSIASVRRVLNVANVAMFVVLAMSLHLNRLNCFAGPRDAPDILDAITIVDDQNAFYLFTLDGEMSVLDVFAPGGYNVFGTVELKTQSGFIFRPSGGSRNAFSHGYDFEEGASENEIKYRVDYTLDLNSRAIPTDVDLEVFLTLRDLLGNEFWSGFIDTIQKPEDGVAPEDRPNISVSVNPSPVPLTDGIGEAEIVVSTHNFTIPDAFVDDIRFSFRGIVPNGPFETVAEDEIFYRGRVRIFNNEPEATEIKTDILVLDDRGLRLGTEFAIPITGGFVENGSVAPIINEFNFTNQGLNGMSANFPYDGSGPFARDTISGVFDVSSVVPVDTVRVFISNPAQRDFINPTVSVPSLVSGNDMDGTYRTSFSFPNRNIDYPILAPEMEAEVFVIVTNVLGGTSEIEPGNEVYSIGLNPIPEGGQIPDQEAPNEITQFSVGENNTVTLIESAATTFQVPADLVVSDNPGEVGVESARFTYQFDDPNGEITDTATINLSWRFADEVSVNGDQTTFTDTFSIRDEHPSGTWRFLNGSLTDSSGNVRTIHTVDPDFDRVASFVLDNPNGDPEKPHFDLVRLSSENIDATGGDDELDFTITAGDVTGEVAEVRIRILKSGALADLEVLTVTEDWVPVEGDAKQGSMVATVPIPGGAVGFMPGEYVYEIRITDSNGRTRIAGSTVGNELLEQPLPDGSDTSFTILNDVFGPQETDLTPVELTSLDVTSDDDLGVGSGSAIVCIGFRDLESGLSTGQNTCRVWIMDPFGREKSAWFNLLDLLEGSGDQNSGTVKVSIPLEQGEPGGDWTLTRIQFTNGAGTEETYSARDQVAIFGGKFPIKNTVGSDQIGPSIAKVLYGPSTLERGVDDSLDIQFSWVDPLFGLDKIEIDLYPSRTTDNRSPASIAEATYDPNVDEVIDGDMMSGTGKVSLTFDTDFGGSDRLQAVLTATDNAGHSQTYDGRLRNSSFNAKPFLDGNLGVLVGTELNEETYSDYLAANPDIFDPLTSDEDKAWHADPDFDGVINGWEVIAGTDPLNPFDFLSANIEQVAGDTIVVSIAPVFPDQNDYFIEELFLGPDNKETHFLIERVEIGDLPVENVAKVELPNIESKISEGVMLRAGTTRKF